MIQINDLTKSFGEQQLFIGVSFSIAKGEKVGLVGRNGSGKSTLFRMIMGDIGPDSGEISKPKGYKVGCLEQHISFTQKSLLEECTQILSGENQYDTYKVEKILFGLGFEESDLNKDPKTFSGGYQIRINLAKVLIKDCDLLLLDEPSNYLDIVSLRWLKSFLRSFSGELILISHDRDFMDSITTHTMGITRKSIKKIQGETLKYYEQLQAEDDVYEKTRANLEKKRKEMERFVERFKAKASKASQAQSRIKMLEKMGQLDRLENERSLGFRFNYKECLSKNLVNIEDISFSYDSEDENKLINQLSFRIGRDDRIAIIGRNGKGKSTLLNLLAGELMPQTGSIIKHANAKIGHFGQTNILRLHNDNNVIEEIQSANESLSISKVRNICGTMMFDGDLAEKKIKVLSGGEKSRVLLGKILAHETNLLLMDEPNNHLDMESVETLTHQISEYPGAVILVTHSELLLRSLANKLIVFHRGGVQFFNGDYDDFLEKIGWEEEEQKTVKTQTKISKKEIKRMRSELISARSKELNPLKNEIEDLETNIISDENRVEKIQAELIDASSKNCGEEIAKLSKELDLKQENIQKMYERLDVISNQYDELYAEYEKRLHKLENM